MLMFSIMYLNLDIVTSKEVIFELICKKYYKITKHSLIVHTHVHAVQPVLTGHLMDMS